MFALLERVLGDVQHPEFYWVALAVALILLVCWWFSYRLADRRDPDGMSGQDAPKAFDAGSLKRVAFPMLALLAVLITRKLLKTAQWEHLSPLDLAVPFLFSWGLIRALIYLLRSVFSQGGFLTGAERWITTSIWTGLVLEVSGLSAPMIELLEQVDFTIGKQKIDLWMLTHGTVTIFATLLIALWVASLIESRLMAVGQMDANVRELLSRLTKAVLLMIALLCSLSLVGIDVTTLSVFSGALAVGLGLGLQRIASNYVSGFILLLDRSIRLGNLVAVDDRTAGTVTQITTRYTVLRTRTGSEVIIPNEYLVNNIVRNLSFTDTNVRVELSVQVAYGTDVEKAMRLLVEAARLHLRVLSEPPPSAVLTGFADNGVNLELRFWVPDPESGTGSVRSDIGLAIIKTFRENSIEIPFPQREVRILSESAGRA